MSSDCEKMKDRIADHITGILSEAQVQSLESHLNECKYCREYARALRKEDALLTELFAEIETGMTNRQEQILRKVNQLYVSKQTESPFIRRIIMKSPITKLAAVIAVLICTGAIATTVVVKVCKYYFVGKESDGTYVFRTEHEEIGNGHTEVSIREYRIGGYRADGKEDPNFTIDLEQKKKDFEEIDLLRQQDARELVRVTEKEVNGKPQRRSFGFKYVLADGREITIGEGDPDTKDRERKLTDEQQEELLQLRLAQKGKDLPSQEKEVKGEIFSFKRQHFVLSDGTEVIVSVGRPK